MAEQRKGPQAPTQSVILPYYKTKDQAAVDLYNSSVRNGKKWIKEGLILPK